MKMDLANIIDQVGKDKGIDKTILVSTLEDAMKTAAKKHFGQDRALEAKFEAGKGVVEIFQAITVVDQVTDPLNAINNITVAQAASTTSATSGSTARR